MIRLDDSSVDNGPAETNALGVVDLPSNSSPPRNTSVESFSEHALGSDLAEPDSTSVGYSYLIQLIKVAAPLWLADLIVIVGASAVGLMVAMLSGMVINHPVSLVAFVATIYSASHFAFGLYPGLGLHPAFELRTLFRSTAFAGASLAVVLGLLTSWGSPYVLVVAIGSVLQLGVMPLARSICKGWMHRRGMVMPVAFLGEKLSVDRMYRDMKCFGSPMLRAVGRFSIHDMDEEYEFSDGESKHEHSIQLIGSVNELRQVSQDFGFNWLIVVGDEAADLLDANPSIASSFPEVIVARKPRSQMGAGSSVVNYGLASGVRWEGVLLPLGTRVGKRTFDIVVSLSALLVLSPLLLAIAACVWLTSPGPILFRNSRIGLRGKSFKAWKFRSMVPNADSVLANYLKEHPELQTEWDRDCKLKNDPRITWIGKFIRRTSLDELPQLWNVLVGEMSLVGPRPILTEEIEKYGLTFREYRQVVPGITGLWQVSGRNNTTYEERLFYVEHYVRHWSPWMDLYILIRTVRTVLFCEGAC